MTTIAYKDGIMAADSKSTDDGYFATKCQKIYRLENGALLGTAGDSDARPLYELLARVRGEKSLPSRQALADTKVEFRGIFVLKNGAAYMIDISFVDHGPECQWEGQLWDIQERFAACGSGEQFALGAMAAGMTAEQAVHIACRFDTRTGPPVRTAILKPRTKAPRK